MRTLVVFYSLEGNTKYIAETVAEQLHADLLELKPKKEYPTRGFQKFFRGGKSAIFRECPELINRNTDVSVYQNILIGTPVWAGTYSAPVNSFLKQNHFEDKKVALFACYAGGGAEKCFHQLKKELANNTFVGEKAFLDPLKHDKEENARDAAQWSLSLPF